MKTPTRTVGPGQQVVDVHHRTEIVTALRQAARLADDTAKFDEAGATAAWPEYEVMRTGSADAAKHTRLLELYPHVIGARNDAAKNRAAAAALYREAADLIESGGPL